MSRVANKFVYKEKTNGSDALLNENCSEKMKHYNQREWMNFECCIIIKRRKKKKVGGYEFVS